MQDAEQSFRIFLNYRREDTSGHAGRLYDALTTHFGTSHVFMDIDTIEPGVDFVDVIESAISSCSVLLALIGQHWLQPSDTRASPRLEDEFDYVRLEIEAALDRDIRVIPVLLQGARMPPPSLLPESMRRLARRNAIDISDHRWRYDLDQLIRVLERIRGDVPAHLPVVTPTTTAVSADSSTLAAPHTPEDLEGLEKAHLPLFDGQADTERNVGSGLAIDGEATASVEGASAARAEPHLVLGLGRLSRRPPVQGRAAEKHLRHRLGLGVAAIAGLVAALVAGLTLATRDRPSSSDVGRNARLQGATRQLSVTRELGGREVAFWIVNGSLVQASQRRPDGRTGWTAWTAVASAHAPSPLSGVAAYATKSGLDEVFATGPAGGVYFAAAQGRGDVPWSAWHLVDRFGSLTGFTNLVAAVQENGAGQLFGVSDDGGLFHTYQEEPDNNGTWSAWIRLAGSIGFTDVALDLRPNGLQQVVCLQRGGALFESHQLLADQPTWSRLRRVGTQPSFVGIAAAVDAHHKSEIFGLTSNGSIYRAFSRLTPTDELSSWQLILRPMGSMFKSLAVGTDANGSLELFAVSPQQVVFHSWQLTKGGSVSWKPWVNLGVNQAQK